jgi:hypothetical protein
MTIEVNVIRESIFTMFWIFVTSFWLTHVVIFSTQIWVVYFGEILMVEWTCDSIHHIQQAHM